MLSLEMCSHLPHIGAIFTACHSECLLGTTTICRTSYLDLSSSMTRQENFSIGFSNMQEMHERR